MRTPGQIYKKFKKVMRYYKAITSKISADATLTVDTDYMNYIPYNIQLNTNMSVIKQLQEETSSTVLNVIEISKLEYDSVEHKFTTSFRSLFERSYTINAIPRNEREKQL